MIRRRGAASAALVASLAVAAVAHAHAAAPRDARPAAPAPPPLVRGLSDGGMFGSSVPALRAGAARVALRAQGRIARFPIAWATVQRSSRFTRPRRSFGPLSDPANADYDWSRIDQAVHDLDRRGLTPMAYFMSAPKWAESAPIYAYAAPGTWAPRPADLAAFASAVARRYDGTYPDPLHPGRTLPRIRLFQSWNEPNLGRFLQPLWIPVHGRAQLFAAGWYREMHRAVDAAIHARQPGAVVSLAGLSSGVSLREGDGRVAPLRFLRSVLCLGRERPKQCGAPLRVDAIALHPLTAGDPDLPAQAADDIAVADVEPKVDALIDDALRHGQIAGGTWPQLWITEMNWAGWGLNSVPRALQGLVVGRAVRRLWQAGAAYVNWQFAVDPRRDRTSGMDRPAGLTARTTRGGQSGLPGRPKAFLPGFALPTVAIPISRSRTYVWAMLPAGVRRARIEMRRRGRWSTAAVATASGGVVERRLAIRTGAAVRVVAGTLVGATIPVRLRVGLPRFGTAQGARVARASAARLLVSGPVATAARRPPIGRPDPRPLDPAGPGAFPALPPVLENGVPPSPSGRNAQLPRTRSVPTGRLRFGTARGAGIVLGTVGADLFSGRGVLFIGFGGHDRRAGSSSN